MLRSARARARQHGLSITITREWISERLVKGVCEVSGLSFSFETSKETRPFSPSLDRINPAGGYTPENCQVVAWLYNAAKMGNTHEDVMRLAEALCIRKKR